MSFDGPMFASLSPEWRAVLKRLAWHLPPAVVWFDADGEFHRRCITDDPNPYCDGCRETGWPPDGYLRFTPPADLPAPAEQ